MPPVQIPRMIYLLSFHTDQKSHPFVCGTQRLHCHILPCNLRMFVQTTHRRNHRRIHSFPRQIAFIQPDIGAQEIPGLFILTKTVKYTEIKVIRMFVGSKKQNCFILFPHWQFSLIIIKYQHMAVQFHRKSTVVQIGNFHSGFSRLSRFTGPKPMGSSASRENSWYSSEDFTRKIRNSFGLQNSIITCLHTPQGGA